MKKGFFKEYALPILAILFFLLSFIWMGTRMTIESNSNSVEDWLPGKYEVQIFVGQTWKVSGTFLILGEDGLPGETPTVNPLEEPSVEAPALTPTPPPG